ncbi:MAG: hypothetical protein NWF04_01000 [Candidatus Bathyarchaeota archaeon]|nr:hypothetical protein [Candidatus Bathyarchaeota archaeon]
MLKKLLRNKKGVSEVIGSLILIFIVTVAGVAVYAYSVSSFNSSSSFFQQQSQNDAAQVRESFSITRVWYDTSNQFNLTLFNHGEIDITINAVYLNGTAVTQYLTETNVRIGVNELFWLKLVSPIPIESGSTLEILVVTQRGGKGTVFYKA